MKRILSKRFKLLAIITLLSSFVYKGSEKEHLSHLSQTAPPDMVYIKGNNTINSFYISTTEEPNIHWQMYLDWLLRVMVDFPEVYQAALPLSNMHQTASRYNDPIIDNYANHPAYYYYPVVGVSWNQIQNYLAWKTDRLNEIILIKNKFIKLDFGQTNENNFNTEAYLEYQFDALIKKRTSKNEFSIATYDTIDPNGFYTNLFIMKHGMFIPQYRLPTEAEWDYASQIKNQEVIKKNKYSIYGGDYFLYKTRDSKPNRFESIYKYYLKPQKGKPYPYPNTMESGVQEWLMDLETFEHKQGYGSLEIYENNGFVKKEKTDSNEIKDFRGKMDYIFADYNDSKPIYIEVDRRGTPFYTYKNIPNPFYQNESLYNQYLNKLYDDGKYKVWVNQYSKIHLLHNKEVTISEKFIPEYTPLTRKVKSGNWKKPGQQTYLLKENETSELIGFRCVLPATSKLVSPQYQVSWN